MVLTVAGIIFLFLQIRPSEHAPSSTPTSHLDRAFLGYGEDGTIVSTPKAGILPVGAFPQVVDHSVKWSSGGGMPETTIARHVTGTLNHISSQSNSMLTIEW